MQRNSSRLANFAGLGIFVFVVSAAWLCADELGQKRANAKKVVVRSDDIGVGTDIHGKLGLPLGRMCTIQGRCVRRGNHKEDDNQIIFRITRVDGTALDTRVELLLTPFGHGKDDSLKIGRSYELRGYEHGQFRGVPDDAYKEYIRGGKPHFATSTGYSFETRFAYVFSRPM